MGKWSDKVRAVLLGRIYAERIIENKTFVGGTLVLDDRPTIVRNCRFYGTSIIRK